MAAGERFLARDTEPKAWLWVKTVDLTAPQPAPPVPSLAPGPDSLWGSERGWKNKTVIRLNNQKVFI